MTTLQAPAGNLEPTRQLLTDSTANILNASDGRVAVSKIRLVNTDSSARTVTLDIYDGTTSQVIVPAKSIAANDVYEFYDDIIPRGHILRGSASVTNVVWIHVLASLPTKPVMS